MLFINGRYYSEISEFHNPNPFTRPQQLTGKIYFYLDKGLCKRGGPGNSCDEYQISTLLLLKGPPSNMVKDGVVYILYDSTEIDIRRLFSSRKEALKFLSGNRYW
jgi:hypothetical protein